MKKGQTIKFIPNGKTETVEASFIRVDKFSRIWLQIDADRKNGFPTIRFSIAENQIAQ